MTGADYIRILPELVLVAFGMLVMIIDPLLEEHNERKGLGAVALAGARRRKPARMYVEIEEISSAMKINTSSMADDISIMPTAPSKMSP